jgi:hypothetical protein
MRSVFRNKLQNIFVLDLEVGEICKNKLLRMTLIFNHPSGTGSEISCSICNTPSSSDPLPVVSYPKLGTNSLVRYFVTVSNDR